MIVEARDQDGGIRGRSKRVKVRVTVTDVNDNAPVIVDPQQDVVAVREQQPPGVEVVTVKAADPDQGNNATITYSILKGESRVARIQFQRDRAGTRVYRSPGPTLGDLTKYTVLFFFYSFLHSTLDFGVF